MSSKKEMSKMEESAIYERLSEVFEMNLNIPKGDEVSNRFLFSLIENTGISPIEENNKTIIKGVHINDALNVLLGCFEYYNINNDNDTLLITSILSVFNTFKNIRIVDFTFDDDPELLDIYNKIVDLEYKGSKVGMFNRIYDIKKMEIYLTDSLDKKVVDLLNKMFIFYGYIPNDYMNRKFTIDFKFDEYINFMNMIFSNNKQLVDTVGISVVDFLILFPVVIIEDKPDIKIITNYYDL